MWMSMITEEDKLTNKKLYFQKYFFLKSVFSKAENKISLGYCSRIPSSSSFLILFSVWAESAEGAYLSRIWFLALPGISEEIWKVKFNKRYYSHEIKTKTNGCTWQRCRRRRRWWPGRWWSPPWTSPGPPSDPWCLLSRFRMTTGLALGKSREREKSGSAYFISEDTKTVGNRPLLTIGDQ